MMDKNDDGLGMGKPCSVESSGSEYQTEVGRFTVTQPVDKNDMIIQFGEYLFDCVAVMLVCPKHQMIALSHICHGKSLWFPLCPIKSGQGFSDASYNYIKQILTVPNAPFPKNFISFKYPQLVNIMRIQMPQYFEFISRVIFFTELTYESGYPSDCCNINNNNLLWYSFDQLTNLANLWGPEPITYVTSYINAIPFSTICFFEFTIKELVNFINGTSVHHEMLRNCGCTEKDIITLYSEFIQHCYPSQFMNNCSFNEYFIKSGLVNKTKEELASLFRAYTFNLNYNFINFYEFILGMAAMDKQTVHGGRIGEVRVGYIFRYYNSSGTPFLEYGDIRSLVRDLLALKNTLTNDESLEREVVASYNTLGVPFKSPVSGKTFARAVGSLQIRGTSALFRVENSPFAYLRNKSLYKEIQLLQLPAEKLQQGAIGFKMHHAKGICPRCKEKQYTLAAHYVKVLQDGNIIEPHEVKGQADVYRMPKAARRLSDSYFYSNNVCNILIDLVRSYAENPRNSNWAQKQCRLDHVEKITKLCNDAEIMFANESRIIKVNSPIHVLGDIHGNLHDLMIYEKIFWRTGPACLSHNFLFLGDYVDRGESSVECIMYLLCAKMLAPNRFNLLRGNHELRSVQQQFTFYRECIDKFDRFGMSLWETFNKVFDSMPLGAVIDEQIYCAHGGIPTSVTKIEQLLATIPCPLVEPEQQSPTAWEVLWNDPISNKEYDEYTNLLKAQNLNNFSLSAGFLPNTKRGTAYYFADEAVNAFLAANGLSHVIRAHEVVPNGFQFHCSGRVITVFSSSKYCGGFNEAAVVLVDLNKIRIMKVDTN